MEDGFMEDGFMEDGFMEDGFMEDGFMEDGFMEDGFMEDGFMEEELAISQQQLNVIITLCYHVYYLTFYASKILNFSTF